MKTLILLSCLFFSHPDTDLLIYRDLLSRSVNSEEVARFYFNKSKTINNSGKPVLRGYKAMASIMMCKHITNPFNRFSYFYKGKAELDAAIQLEPKNPELLFLRFATQCNTPAFLGYNNNMTADKLFLFDYINNKNSEEDPYLRNKIIKFMLQCKKITEAEKKLIH